MSCLYIFEINSLSVALFALIFSHSEGCLFTLLIVSFAVQKLLSLIKSTCLLLFLFPLLLEVGHGGSYFMSESVLPMFSSRIFILSGLTFRFLIRLSLFLCMVLESVLVSFFSGWLTSFSSTTF